MAKLSLHFKPNALIVEENSLIIRHERIEPHRLHENKFKNPKQKKKKKTKNKKLAHVISPYPPTLAS